MTKDRRRNRLKRVMLATNATTMNQKDFRERVTLDDEREDFDSNPILDVTRYRTSSQELQEMVGSIVLAASATW